MSSVSPFVIEQYKNLITDGVNSSTAPINYTSIESSFQNALQSVENDKAGFGELRVSQTTPIFQYEFVHSSIDTLKFETVTSNGGTITTSDGLVNISTDSQISSSSDLKSRIRCRYRAGQGMLLRWTTKFTGTFDNGNTGLCGFFDNENGIALGYINGVFGLLRIRNSVNYFIPRTSWDNPLTTGVNTLDLTKGLVWEYSYKYLGFGSHKLRVESSTGQWITVHEILYSNQNTISSFQNPTFSFRILNQNTSSNTIKTISCASCFAGVEGIIKYTGHYSAISNSKTVVTTDVNILTIRNNTTHYLGGSNKNKLRIILSSLATDGTKPAVISYVYNATLTTPSFSSVSNSNLEFDTAGTYTPSSGRVMGIFNMSKSDGKVLDFERYDFALNSSDTITILAKYISGAGGDVSVSITVQED
jgi:hypothetical protein